MKNGNFEENFICRYIHGHPPMLKDVSDSYQRLYYYKYDFEKPLHDDMRLCLENFSKLSSTSLVLQSARNNV